MIGLGLDLSLKWRPTGGLDPLVSAFKAESGATDVTGLNNLIKYVRSEGLTNNFVIYPMKADQNAGSGPTVYPLGSLTGNDMTLFNSPTWASDGIYFNGANQYWTATDFLGGSTNLTIFARVKDQVEPAGVDLDAIVGQWRPETNDRSRLMESFGSGNSSLGGIITLARSSDGSAVEVYTMNAPPSSWGVDATRVAQWIDGGGRAAWLNKSQISLSLGAGTDQTSSYDTAIDISGMALDGGTNLAQGTMVSAAFVESTTLTATQRETITDLINAL